MTFTADEITWIHLVNAEPSVTAIASRRAQTRAYVLPSVLPQSNSTATTNASSAAIGETQRAIPIVDAPQSAIDVSVSQLLKLQDLSDNWDGYGAAKPKRESMDAAHKFLRSLALESVIPRPALHADGNAILFFTQGERQAQIEFLDQDTAEFFAKRGDEEWSDVLKVDGSLPKGLLEIGFSI